MTVLNLSSIDNLFFLKITTTDKINEVFIWSEYSGDSKFYF
jgi:hypothetical protein